MKILYIIISIFGSIYLSIAQNGRIDQSDDGMSGTISFGGMNDLNDEMYNSQFVPFEMQCEACKIVAYQLWNGLKDYIKRHSNYKANIPESNLIDLMENICSSQKSWDGYGMKKIQKVTHLSGPGLDTEDEAGVTVSGGKWPTRLQDMCESYVGDHGEVTLYNVFKIDPSKKHLLTNFMCYNQRGKCVREEKEKKIEL